MHIEFHAVSLYYHMVVAFKQHIPQRRGIDPFVLTIQNEYSGVDNMQEKEVRAFRQRLVRGGFTDISIYDNAYGRYTVYCTSWTGEKIRRNMTIAEMINTPHLVWFD